MRFHHLGEDSHGVHNRHFIASAGLLLAVLVGMASPALAVDPWVDTGFTETTSRPDPDLVIVREAFYGEEGVDLSAFGIPDGPHTFVQSIYFRLFVDNDAETVDSFTGLVILPPELVILGFVVDETLLGGADDDGLWTASDLTFGIGGDPDRYSEFARGFEIGGGVSSSEFIGSIDHHTFVFGLNVTDGVDDFRVIVDYGDAFTEGLAFDLLAYDIGVLGGAIPTDGIRVGDDADPVVFGSGDYGETPSLLDIPLTSTTPPVPADALSYDPLAAVFILRDTSGSTWVDGYDTVYDVPLPNLVEIATNLDNPVGISDGEDGFLYAVGLGGGFATINPANRSVVTQSLGDLAGSNVDVTNLAGTDSLFVIRDTSGDSEIDVIDPAIPDFVDAFPIVGPTNPVGITDGFDSRLYVLGAGGTLAWIYADGSGGDAIILSPPAGTYVDLTSLDESTLLYLLRDTSGDSEVDVYDTVSQSISYGFSTFYPPGTPIGITDGPSGDLHVIGVGGVDPAHYVMIDALNGDVLVSHNIMDFPGSNIRITNLDVLTTVDVADHEPAAASLRHCAVPNPSHGGVSIRFELPVPLSVTVTIFDVQGRRIRQLRMGTRGPGWQSSFWDGRDQSGRPQPSGTYFYRVQAAQRLASGKLQLLR